MLDDNDLDFQTTGLIETEELQQAILEFYKLALIPDMYLGYCECGCQQEAEKQLADSLRGWTKELKAKMGIKP